MYATLSIFATILQITDTISQITDAGVFEKFPDAVKKVLFCEYPMYTSGDDLHSSNHELNGTNSSHNNNSHNDNKAHSDDVDSNASKAETNGKHSDNA